MKHMTMNEIAKLAKVGKTTVSRYFNGGYVAEGTKAKIKEIIDQYNYVPSMTAQALKAKHSYQIAIISPTMESVTSGRVLTAMDEELRSLGYTPFIFNTNHNMERELLSLVSLSRMNVEGVIVLATTITQAHIDLVHSLRMPVLFVAQSHPLLPHITLPDEKAGKLLMEYILENGHTKITYVGVSESDEAVGQRRKAGILEALKAKGLDLHRFIETDFTFEHSVKVLEEQLKSDDSSAIVCATDTIALAAYHVLKSLGKEIGKDVALAGFGGYASERLLEPSLTSIRYDFEGEGVLAARYLHGLIQHEPFERKEVDFHLVKGNSVMKI